ncbi:aa3-type cytochrome c oxidase subunit IV [Prosthecomicrobium hirschii]|uniref:aa3-type cytochrome c oxidase subunit IV n=1 Tax=Prosthecodimorpha hirschii TaxID=665126 RepID=UPI0030840FA5
MTMTREGRTMAEHSPMDYAEHEKTYKLFIAMTKWGTIGVVVLLALMAVFLL